MTYDFDCESALGKAQPFGLGPNARNFKLGLKDVDLLICKGFWRT
jgi:hypothetical protein